MGWLVFFVAVIASCLLFGQTVTLAILGAGLVGLGLYGTLVILRAAFESSVVFRVLLLVAVVGFCVWAAYPT
jgi:hypothetical protein